MAKATKPLKAPKINDAFPSDKINANFKGLEVIKSFAKILPKKPGVYQMENEKEEI